MQEWLNCGVEGEASWPKKRTKVQFGEYELFLFPMTKDHSASVHVELVGQRLDNLRALTIINRFLSLIAWCDDAPMRNNYGWSGGPVPQPVPKRLSGYSPADIYPFCRQPLDEPMQRIVVALYREARSVDNVPYEFLSYYKIVNVHRSDSKDQRAWINQTIPVLSDEQACQRIRELKQTEADLGNHLFVSGRCAVAHASVAGPNIDPDDVSDLRRLSRDLPVIKALARYLIKHEFEVSDSLY